LKTKIGILKAILRLTVSKVTVVDAQVAEVYVRIHNL